MELNILKGIYQKSYYAHWWKTESLSLRSETRLNAHYPQYNITLEVLAKTVRQLYEHHCIKIDNISITFQIPLCPFTIHPFPQKPCPDKHWFIFCPLILSFSECHRTWIIQDVALSLALWLGKMHLRFIHIHHHPYQCFVSFYCKLLFHCKNIP